MEGAVHAMPLDDNQPLLDLIPFAVLVVSPDGIVQVANAAVEPLFGWEPAELVGRPVDLLVPGAQRAAHADRRRSYHESEDPRLRPMSTRTTLHGLRRDGSEFPVDIQLSTHPESGDAVATIRDTSSDQAANRRLRDSQSRLEYAQQVARLGFWDWDIETGALYWSDQIYRIFGLAPRQFGASYEAFLERVHPEDRDLVQGAVAAALADEAPYKVDHRIVLPSGIVRYVHEQGEVSRGPDGKPVRMIGTVLDITERKELEQQLVRAQRMEALGQLSSGVAHDFNNLLAIIGSYAAMLHEEAACGQPRVRHDIEQILGATDRAAALTRQLVAFSQKAPIRRQPVSLNTVVTEMLPMLQRALGNHIPLETDLDPSLPACAADPTQLEQILLNLVVNARDAMPAGGTIRITTRGQPDEVLASVADTGTGIPPEQIDRVFEPFFTTKPVGRGTGLGLATCKGLVQQMGGTIDVASTEGVGTTFTTRFPAIRQPPVPRETTLLPGTPPGGNETILVVEDQRSVRALLIRILEGAGYTVLAASSGARAIEAATGHGGPIHLLVSDVLMPNMTGDQLYRRICQLRPGLPVLFVTGYADEDLAPGWTGTLPTLAKPFHPRRLLQEVRRVIEGAS